MSADPGALQVTEAEARAAAARHRLTETVGTLQTRLNPRIVARDAVEGLTESGEKALRTGVETARAHPSAVMVAATIAVAWLARRRIGAALRLPRKRTETNATGLPLARSIPGDWPEPAERKKR
ncbi:DUF3618 domain-containing protein [Sphingomonas radiodurans]|uniref:DUF3618 domain-containing protein n=1 Tax=Sphingomonas radiodurans TaxID=2890321 RepID=UPI001E4268B1|nr:DUF3618 domain-containing protein [Sphingomonas radiodurans]WBH17149.1 DUF3618 domain-containing protein [Sphingomonas radiodurans]